MAGITSDYLIYPIMDLIKKEVSRTVSIREADPFEGEPSVSLWKDHPVYDDGVSGATLTYESGYAVQIDMSFGSEDSATYPVNISPGDAEWDYYRYARLMSVQVVTLNPAYQPLLNYTISLNYDDRGLLTGTTATRI